MVFWVVSYVWNILNGSNSGPKWVLRVFQRHHVFLLPASQEALDFVLSQRALCVCVPLSGCLPSGVTTADPNKDSASPRGSRSMAMSLPEAWG